MTEKEINIYNKNKYYWQYQDKPVLLLGGSVEDNLFQIPDLKKQLDLIAEIGGNYVRNTMSSRDQGNVWPFKKAGDKYDLNRWNQEYWHRFSTFLNETYKRNIIVQIEIWATFDYYRENWNQENPFNPLNNITYTLEETNLPGEVNTHPTQTENNFFRSVPAENNQKLVLKYQQKFVNKILSYTLDYGHILYCMDNETSVTPEWGKYWAQYIKDKAEKKDKKIYTTEMWDAWELSHSQHDNTFNHPEIYDFVDVSQNNHNTGQKHYSNAIKQRKRIENNPRPMNNVKIYGGFGDYGSIKDGVERFWRNIFAGMASCRFHRPESGIGINKKAQNMIKGARKVLKEFNIFQAIPDNTYLEKRNEDEAYLLQAENGSILVYFPDGGFVNLNMSGIAQVNSDSKYSLHWFDIETCNWAQEIKIKRGDLKIELFTPAEGQWLALLKNN
ncbi:MAG: hypothetical protein ACOCQ5_00870 [Halanaerobiales bacterium]